MTLKQRLETALLNSANWILDAKNGNSNPTLGQLVDPSEALSLISEDIEAIIGELNTWSDESRNEWVSPTELKQQLTEYLGEYDKE